MGCIAGEEIVAVIIDRAKITKAVSQDIPPTTLAMVSLNQGIIPKELRKLAIITRAANQHKVSQAPVSFLTSSQESTLVNNNTDNPIKAVVVALIQDLILKSIMRELAQRPITLVFGLF